MISPLPPKTQLLIEIGGMKSNSCAGRIENSLKREKEITDVSVNYATESGRITYNSKAISPETLVKMIEDMGYSAKIATIQEHISLSKKEVFLIL